MSLTLLNRIITKNILLLFTFCLVYFAHPTICFNICTCQIDGQPVIWTYTSVPLCCPINVNSPTKLVISKMVALQDVFTYDLPGTVILSGDFSGRVTHSAAISGVSVTITNFTDPLDVDNYRCRITDYSFNKYDSFVDLAGRVFQAPLSSDINVTCIKEVETSSYRYFTAETNNFTKNGKPYPIATISVTANGTTVNCSEVVNSIARVVTCQLDNSFTGQICAVASLCDVSSVPRCLDIPEQTTSTNNVITAKSANSLEGDRAANGTCDCSKCTRSGNWCAIASVVIGIILIFLLIFVVAREWGTYRRHNSDEQGNCIPASRVDIHEAAAPRTSGKQPTNSRTEKHDGQTNSRTEKHEGQTNASLGTGPVTYINQSLTVNFLPSQSQMQQLGHIDPGSENVPYQSQFANKTYDVNVIRLNEHDNKKNEAIEANDSSKDKKKKKKKKRNKKQRKLEDDNEATLNYNNNNNGTTEKGGCGCSFWSVLWHACIEVSVLLLAALVVLTYFANDNVSCDVAMCNETCESSHFQIAGYCMVAVSCILLVIVLGMEMKKCTDEKDKDYHGI